MASEVRKVSHIGTLLESQTLSISLRNLQLDDAPAFARLLSDPRNSSDPHIKPMDVSTAESVIARMRKSASEPTTYDASGRVLTGPGRVNLVVVLKSEDQPEGTVIGLGGYGAIKELERDGQKLRAGDVGVLIDADYRGKGYATEALKLAMDWGFAGVGEGGLQLDRITITTLDDNEPVIKLVSDKLGLDGKSVEREAEIEGKTELYWELKKGDWVMN
ncbi:GNAT domain-containing protein [Dactylonectria estremocensis]|uniref:GNAT domain-containing protein n=1 Tax=Dactylonectria estremocensis TaxID=1079267 RepID=A0A9P9EV67_9HYPO|nr:GNAT domain-containing protein [Dactylonectria estremocensis]